MIIINNSRETIYILVYTFNCQWVQVVHLASSPGIHTFYARASGSGDKSGPGPGEPDTFLLNDPVACNGCKMVVTTAACSASSAPGDAPRLWRRPRHAHGPRHIAPPMPRARLTLLVFFLLKRHSVLFRTCSSAVPSIPDLQGPDKTPACPPWFSTS